ATDAGEADRGDRLRRDRRRRAARVADAVVAGVGARKRQAADGDGLVDADILVGECAGGRGRVQAHRVADNRSGKRRRAGVEADRGRRVVDAIDAVDADGGDRLRRDLRYRVAWRTGDV